MSLAQLVGGPRGDQDHSAERTHDRFGVAFDDSQQNAGGAVRYATSLFPILHGTRIETETVRKFLPAQLHSLPQCENPFRPGIVYYAAGQVHFPANMGENLLQGSFDLLTCPGSFRRHQFDSFLIAATSREKALRSAAVRSSRSALAYAANM